MVTNKHDLTTVTVVPQYIADVPRYLCSRQSSLRQTLVACNVFVMPVHTGLFEYHNIILGSLSKLEKPIFVSNVVASG